MGSRAVEEKIEAAMDVSASLTRFLEDVQGIIHEKSFHVEQSYGDRELAKAWRRVGKALTSAIGVAYKEGI